MMRASVIALAVAAIGSASARGSVRGQVAAPDSVAEREGRTLRKALRDARNRNDRAALERIVAPGFTFIHSTGNIDTRQRWVDNAVATTQSATSSTDYLEDQLRLYGSHTAVWTTRSISRPQRGREVRLRSTNTYVKIGGRWQWAAGQSTRLSSRPAPAAIDRRLNGEYSGQHEVGEGRMLSITAEGETLKGRLPGLLPADLIPRSETEFVWFNPESNVYSEMIFVGGDSGQVTHVLYRSEGVDVWRAPKLSPCSR